MPSGGSAHNRCVGDATSDDNVGAAVERIDDAPTTEIGVGGDEPRCVAHGLAGFEVSEVDASGNEFVEAWQQVVAVDVGNGWIESELCGHLGNGLGAAGRVEAARIGDHLDASIEAGAHHLFHLLHEATRIAAAGSLGLCTRQDQHRELGQPIAGENVDWSVGDHLFGGRQTVAVETRTVGDTHWLLHDAPSVAGSASGSIINKASPLPTC